MSRPAVILARRAIVALALVALQLQVAAAQDVPIVWGGQTDPVLIRGRECRVPNGMVNFFHPSDPLFRHSISLVPRFVRDDVNILAGHGGPGGGCGWREYAPDLSGYTPRHCTPGQRNEILGMFNHEVNRAGRNPVCLNLNCYSGIPRDGEMSMAERTARCLATSRPNVPGMWNVQIGMVGEVGTPRTGNTLCIAQRNALFDNPRGMIVYYGIPLRDGTVAVEAVYVRDGSQILQNISRNPDSRPITFGPWMQDDHLGMGCGSPPTRWQNFRAGLNDRLMNCNPGGLDLVGAGGSMFLVGGALTADGLNRCADEGDWNNQNWGVVETTAGSYVTVAGGGMVLTGGGMLIGSGTLTTAGTTVFAAAPPVAACALVGTGSYVATRQVDNCTGGRISGGIAVGFCAVGDFFANVCYRCWTDEGANWDLTSTMAGDCARGWNPDGSPRCTLRGPARCGGGNVRPPQVDPPYQGEDAGACAAGARPGGAAWAAVVAAFALVVRRRRRR